MRDFRFENVRFIGSEKNKLPPYKVPSPLYTSILKKMLNLTTKSKYALSLSLRFFATYYKDTKLNRWSDFCDFIVPDIELDMQIDNASDFDLNIFEETQNILFNICERYNNNLLNFVRSNYLEMLNKYIIEKDGLDFYHEPKEIYVKYKSYLLGFSNRQYKNKRLDYFAPDYNNNILYIYECKSDINMFFINSWKALTREKGTQKIKKNRKNKNILKNINQLSFFKNIIKKFDSRCINGSTNAAFVTYIGKMSVIHLGGTHKIPILCEEDIVKKVF